MKVYTVLITAEGGWEHQIHFTHLPTVADVYHQLDLELVEIGNVEEYQGYGDFLEDCQRYVKAYGVPAPGGVDLGAGKPWGEAVNGIYPAYISVGVLDVIENGGEG